MLRFETELSNIQLVRRQGRYEDVSLTGSCEREKREKKVSKHGYILKSSERGDTG
jgi:hypothetical protein